MIAALSWFNATKNAWLAIAIVLGAGGVWFANVSIKNQRQAAYEKGVDAGKGAASTATVVEALKTIDAGHKAEAETPLPSDKNDIIERCKRSASCRERGALK